MITKNNFKCGQCAECCKLLTVKISNKEIKKIQEKGYDDFFFQYDEHIDSNILERDDNGCVFLNGNKCKIYDIRPKVCSDYPFVEGNEIETCKPKLFGKK
jgi:uncharacterized protein